MLYLQGSLHQLIPGFVKSVLETHGNHDNDADYPMHDYALGPERLHIALSKDLKCRLSAPSQAMKIAALVDQHANALNSTRFQDAVFCALTGTCL